MSFNTFGYNGVFELEKGVVDKLLAQVYERNLVEQKGGVAIDDEFLELKLKTGSTQLVLYLKYGRPATSFAPSASASNRVDLSLPVTLAVFVGEQKTTGQSGSGTPKQSIVWRRESLKLLGFDLSRLILRLDDIALVKASKPGGRTVLQPEFAAVTGKQIKLIWPTNGQEIPDTLFDPVLGAKLSIKASEIKNEIAKQLKGDALKNLDIEVPTAGLNMKALSSWDFRLVSQTKPDVKYDGFDLLLYGPGNAGRGVPASAGNTIPTVNTGFANLALSLRGDVFLKYVDELLDTTGYYQQGGTLNTASNPYGYMVVPAKATAKYNLPGAYGGAGKTVTVSEPQNGVVQVTVPKGGFAPKSRARLTNDDTGVQVNFEAAGDGAASLNINAATGARLTVSVQAVSAKGDADAIVYRPKFSLHAGKIRIDFHYYYHIDNWCDAEGDGWIDIGLKADRDEAFSVSHSILDKEIDLPWWAPVVGFLVGLLTGGAVAGPVGGILGGILFLILVEAIGSSIVGDLVSGKLDKNLKDQLKFPSPGGGLLALFLEQVDIHQTGIVMAGVADAGQIVHYGRKAVDAGPKTVVQLGTGSAGLSIHFSQSSAAVAPKAKTYWAVSAKAEKDGLKPFTAALYEDGEKAAFKKGQVGLAAGTPTVLWLDHDEGLAKVLLEWEPVGNQVRATWVLFRERIKPSLKIENHITRTTTGSANIVIGYWITFKYDGYLSLAARKFFRTSTSREAGLEHWYWNGKEIPQDGTVSAPGLTFHWDTKNDRIVVNVSQGKLGSPVPEIQSPGAVGLYVPQAHTFEYKGEDVFGTKMNATLKIGLPASESGSLDLLYDVGMFRHEILPDPPWEMPEFLDLVPFDPPPPDGLPVERLRQVIAERLSEVTGGDVRAVDVANDLATALIEGRTHLDREGAQRILSMLGRAERG